MEIRFEWDERKNRSNQDKHKVSFEEAAQAFRDPLCVSVQDRIEDGEERWQTIGLVGGAVLLVVAHTLREISTGQEVIRIISARAATLKERRRYEDEDR